MITKDAVTDSGLFDVHIVDDTHFYEIPDSLLIEKCSWLAEFPKQLPELDLEVERSTHRCCDGRKTKKSTPPRC